MNDIVQFIRACECFYVVTLNGEYPAARPFGAIMAMDDLLYIATHDGNEAHKQLLADGHIQLVAKKPGTRAWLRVTGIARRCDDLALKQRFLMECPALRKHYASAESTHYLLFQIAVQNAEFME